LIVAPERADWLPAGRIGRPHGLDGSFKVTRPRPELLRLGAKVRVSGSEAEVVRLSGTQELPIVRLTGIGTREQVEALRGADLLCPRAEAPELGPDEWFAEDLEGCRVVDREQPVGVVRALVGLPSVEVLEVERAGAADLLVPMVRDAIRGVDVAGRVIGRGGRTANALRTVIKAAAVQENRRVLIDIVD
jgi:16S rRNA processing protein RimM